MKGASLTLHPEEEQLLRYLDGEMPARAADEIRSHLEACWQCRAALEELQDVVSQCVHYRKNVLQRHLPAPPAPWVDIYRSFDEIDASLEPAFFPRLAGWFTPPFDAAFKKWAIAPAVLLVLLGLFYRYRQTPSVQASQLLRQAIVAATAHPDPHRRIQIRTRDRRLTRPAISGQKTAASADADALNSLEAIFQRANYSWTEPLSAQSFQAWRNQLPDQRDQVIEENVTQQSRAYRIETSTSSSVLKMASLTLRAGDLRPTEERLEFSNSDWVEIREIPDDAAPPPPLSADANRPRSTSLPASPLNETPNPVLAPPASATAADELQVVAALHDLGADLGEPVEVSRSGSEVLVSGVGIPAGRQQEIKNALASNSHVIVRFSDSPPANVEDQTSTPTDSPAGGDLRQLQSRFAEQLGGRANLEQLAAQVLDSSESLMAHAFALRRLAEQFPLAAEQELKAGDRDVLKRLRTEHSAAMRRQTAAMDRELQPILATVNGGGPTDSSVPSEPWQAAAEELFQTARRLDKLVGVMFGAAPSDTPGGQLPAQLKTGLAQLRARLDIYEQSNK